jgi:hypothetical protein
MNRLLLKKNWTDKKSFNILNVLVALLLGILLFIFFPVNISLKLQSNTGGLINISYSSDDFIKDGQSVYFNTKVSPNFEEYKAIIPAHKLSSIKVNPISTKGDFKIKSLSYRFLYKEVVLKGEELISSVKSVNNTVIPDETETGYYKARATTEETYIEIANTEFTDGIINSNERYLFSALATIISFFLGTLLFKAIKNKVINKKTLCISNIVVTIIILVLPPDGLSYFKLFVGVLLLYFIPGYILLNTVEFFRKQKHVHTKFVLAIVAGFSLWFTSLYITSEVGITISPILIYSIVGISFIIFLFILYKKFSNKNIEKIFTVTSTDLVLFFLFNVLLFVYIVPLKGLLVAPLHDPAAISIHARSLIDSGYILKNIPQDYLYYPPGGFFLVALPETLLNITTSKITMILTNFFNILTGVAFATLMGKLFKGKYLPIISIFVLSFISLYPSSEYFRAGKNAQVIGYVFLFISLYFFYNAIDKGVKSKFLFLITFFTSSLIHYNNLLITAVFCITIYLYKRLRDKEFSFKLIYKDLLLWLPYLMLGLGLFYLQLNVIKSVESSTSKILAVGETSFELQNFFEWFIEYRNFRVSRTIINLGVLSYLFLTFRLIFTFFKRKKINYEILFVILTLVVFYVAIHIPVTRMRNYFILNMFLIYVLPIAISLNYILQQNVKLPLFFKKGKHPIKISLNYIIILALILIGIENMSYLYRRFNRVRIYSVVQEADLEAFEWIDNNLPPNSRFLPAHIRDISFDSHRFIYDSILYMKAFTNSYEVFSFVHAERLPNRGELAKKYLLLIEEPENNTLLKEFTDSQIYYVFSGSARPWGCGDVPCDFFELYPETYSVIYDKDGVKIYEITVKNQE